MNTLSQARQLAQELSDLHECDQYVQFRVAKVTDGDKGIVEGTFFVSDWYSSDNTIARFFNGEEITV